MVVKVMELKLRGVKQGVYRLCATEVVGLEKSTIAFCIHDHKTVDEAELCPAALHSKGVFEKVYKLRDEMRAAGVKV